MTTDLKKRFSTSSPVNVAVLGHGDMGTKTLSAIRNDSRLRLASLWNRSFRKGFMRGDEQVDGIDDTYLKHLPPYLFLGSDSAATEFIDHFGLAVIEGNKTIVKWGDSSLNYICKSEPTGQIIANMLSGTAAIQATLTALENGKFVINGNKETLCCAGSIIMAAAKANPNSVILSPDSEVSAVERSFLKYAKQHSISFEEAVEKAKHVFVPSSGGRFRDPIEWPKERMSEIKPEQVVNLNWPDMGFEVQVLSATTINKWLEMMQIHYLFDVPFRKFKVITESKSNFHGGVLFEDGTLIGQVGTPDMMIPIAHSFHRFFGTHKDTYSSDDLVVQMRNGQTPSFDDFTHVANALLEKPLEFNFGEIDYKSGRFPNPNDAIALLSQGGTMHTVITVAAEKVIEAFGDERIKFTDVQTYVTAIAAHYSLSDKIIKNPTLEQILKVKEEVETIVEHMVSSGDGIASVFLTSVEEMKK